MSRWLTSSLARRPVPPRRRATCGVGPDAVPVPCPVPLPVAVPGPLLCSVAPFGGDVPVSEELREPAAPLFPAACESAAPAAGGCFAGPEDAGAEAPSPPLEPPEPPESPEPPETPVAASSPSQTELSDVGGRSVGLLPVLPGLESAVSVVGVDMPDRLVARGRARVDVAADAPTCPCKTWARCCPAGWVTASTPEPRRRHCGPQPAAWRLPEGGSTGPPWSPVRPAGCLGRAYG